MSTSRHPVALRLEELVGGDVRLLALVMGLPLIDGIFPALILAGALDDPIGAFQVGLLIFGGSATVAVILADMTGTPREQAKVVLLVGIPLIVVAAIQAALAPAIESVLDLVIFERFAALVIAAIAAKTASATIGEYLPSPAVVIGLGLLASLDPSGATFALLEAPTLVAHATGAAVVGVGFALSVALLGPFLRHQMDIDRFRFGSAVALGLLPLSLLGMPFGNAPLAVLCVTALFALDPGTEATGETEPAGTLTDGGEDSVDSDSTDGVEGAESDASRETDSSDRERVDESSDRASGPESSGTEGTSGEAENAEPYPSDDTTGTEGRAPWL